VITTAQINEPHCVGFSAQADPPHRPQAGSGAVSGERDRDDHRGRTRPCPRQAQRQANPQHRGGRARPRGTAEMTMGEEQVRLSAGEIVLVPALAPHELYNVGSDELRTVAFSTTPRSSPCSTMPALRWRAGY
jgi:hypothetical protein